MGDTVSLYIYYLTHTYHIITDNLKYDCYLDSIVSYHISDRYVCHVKKQKAENMVK